MTNEYIEGSGISRPPENPSNVLPFTKGFFVSTSQFPEVPRSGVIALYPTGCSSFTPEMDVANWDALARLVVLSEQEGLRINFTSGVPASMRVQPS